MATISETFSTGSKTLSSTTADLITLASGGPILSISNISGTSPLHVNFITRTGGAKAQGTLTMAAVASGGVAAQGTLTIAEPVTDGDTFTIGDITYTLEDTLTTTGIGNILIGADEAATKVNIVAAINNSGGGGTLYSGSTKANPLVSAAAFSGDDCVLTATSLGTAGNAIDTTETFTHVSNVFDAATLGTTTAGSAADTMTIGDRTYTWVADALDTTVQDQILVGLLAFNKLAFVDMINGTGTYLETLHTAHTRNEAVSAAAFSTHDCVLTARLSGAAGNSIATTETFLSGSNSFDAATLGTTTAGADDAPSTATAAPEHIVIPPLTTRDLDAKAYGIQDGVTLSLVGSANVYCVQYLQ